MSLDSKTILAQINTHMNRSGISNRQWYVGITSDIEQRLFRDHGVPKSSYWYIFREAHNADEARLIMDAYHKAGCKGTSGGGDDTSTIVYAYVTSAQTKE